MAVSIQFSTENNIFKETVLKTTLKIVKYHHE